MKNITIKVPDDCKAISITVISGENSVSVGTKCCTVENLEYATIVFNGIDTYLEPKRRNK